MRKLVPVLAGIATVMFLCGTALAQDPKDDNALTRSVDIVFQILMVVLPLIAVWLVHRGLAMFEKKAGIDVPHSIERKIDGWVKAGIHLAAERSHKKITEKTGKLTGPEKLEEAADFVFDLANARGWIEWTKEKIKAKIEAQLGLHRADDE
jgi:hypothetical protein